MSVILVSKEIERFLTSKTPEVICITGGWGVGKTFAWNYYLKKRQKSADSAVALPKYTYISLFGKNSIDDVRAAIVENTVDSRIADLKPDLNSFGAIFEQLKSSGGFVSKWGSALFGNNAYTEGARRVLYLGVKEQIVCIDDLERAGPGLDMRLVLGLASNLKEERKCKVVILLNREKLLGSAQEEFNSQLEKVADTVMVFQPTAPEAAEIGLDKSNKFHSQLFENVVTLGIVNIRVIKKIEAYCCRLSEILNNYDARIMQQAVHTATLIGFSILQKDEAPSIDYIKSFNYISAMSAKKTNEADLKFKELLQRYNFRNFDELDKVIADGIERGFFDESKIAEVAGKAQDKIDDSDKNESFGNAWNFVRESFDDNENEVIDRIVASAKENLSAISSTNLSATVSFLKEFGRKQEAADLISLYISQDKPDRKFWDLHDNVFGGEVKDADVITAFGKKYADQPVDFAPEELLMKLARTGCEDDELEHLAQLDEEALYKIFKSNSGDRLKLMVYGALKYRNVSGAVTQTMKEIVWRGENVLQRIAKESRLNAKRVEGYGIRQEKDQALGASDDAVLTSFEAAEGSGQA